ncbi:MAG TPA: hypothetical protein PLV42_03960 [bacterium]|nr:hypothetical protein [bacterium]
MAKNIMLVLVGKRRESAAQVQKLLTDYGCYIKTRLGLHDASESVCSEDGLIILELVGDKAKQQELFNALKKVPCLNVKLETLAIDNCPK